MILERIVAPVARIEWFVYSWERCQSLLSCDKKLLRVLDPMGEYRTTQNLHSGRSLVVSATADHLMDEVYSRISQKMQQDIMENLVTRA